jgi:hypothetical protein
MTTTNPTALQILTKPVDPLAARMLELERKNGGGVKVVDLTEGSADYDALVEAVFEADHVRVW